MRRTIEARRTASLAVLALFIPVGGILFTLSWAALGFFSKGYTIYGAVVSSYSPLAQPISGLGLGATAPMMNLAFMVFGGLFFAVGMVGVFAASRGGGPALSIGNALLASLPLGSFFCGVFTLQDGFAHYLSAMIAFSLPIPGFLLAGLSLRKKEATAKGLAGLLIAAGPATLLLVAWYMSTFNPVDAGNNIGIAGLTERLLIVWVQGIFSIYGLACSRRRIAAA